MFQNDFWKENMDSMETLIEITLFMDLRFGRTRL
jgi:hypothetical protein